MRDLLINPTVAHGLLWLLPALCALLLRWARCPGWPVLGGAVAGILLSPTILGRLEGVGWEHAYLGAVQERQAMDRVLREQGAERLAAAAARVDEAALLEMDRRHERALAEARSDYDEARWSAQRPLRYYAAIVIALALLGAGLRRKSPAASSTARRETGPRGSPLAVISIGLWSAALPGALAAASMIWFWRRSWPEAFLVGAAVAIGPWALTRADRDTADAAELGGSAMLGAAGRIASLVALIAAGWSLMAQRGAEGWMWLAALAALPIGWLVGALLPPARRAEEGRGDRRIGIDLSYLSRVVLDVFIVPALAASVALRIEWFHHFAIWPVLLLVILSGDARWLGALLGAMTLGGRRWLRTMRLVLGSMACGPTQLAITSIAIHGWILPERFVAALLLGAITVELTAPARRGLARRLAEAEVELDRLDEEA